MTDSTQTQPQSFQQYESQCRKFVEGFQKDNPTAILQYVRQKTKPNGQSANGSKNRHKRGVIIAFKGLSGEIRAGYSLCNVSKERNGFRPVVGIRKAIDRSIPVDEINWEEVPHGARKTLRAVCDRARKYYDEN